MSGIVGHRGLLLGGDSPPPGGDDPYFANVVLLLDASARADGSTPSDIDVTGKTPTWTSGAQCKTDQFVFGSSSMYFDGVQARVSFADDAAWAMGLGDFTVEAWVRPAATARSKQRILIGQSDVYNGFYPFSMRATSDGDLQAGISDGTTVYEATASASDIPVSTWTHVALVRSGGNLYGYVGGTRYTLRSDVAAVSVLNSTGRLAVGAYSDFDAVDFKWLGHMDQVRVTKGVARYTAATISVPTGPFPHS